MEIIGVVAIIIGLFSGVIGLVGWFGFHSLTMLIIGALLYVVETILQWKSLNNNSKSQFLYSFIIGSIVGIFVPTPWYICGMIGMCIWSSFEVLFILIMGIIALFSTSTNI